MVEILVTLIIRIEQGRGKWKEETYLPKGTFQFFFFFFNVYLFLRKTEIECEWVRGRERGRNRIQRQVPGSELAVSTEPDTGLEPTNCKIMT